MDLLICHHIEFEITLGHRKGYSMWGEGRERRAERENEVIVAQRRILEGTNLMRQSGSEKVKLRKRVF